MNLLTIPRTTPLKKNSVVTPWQISLLQDRLFLIVSKGPPYKITGVLVEIMAIIANYMGVW